MKYVCNVNGAQRQSQVWHGNQGQETRECLECRSGTLRRDPPPSFTMKGNRIQTKHKSDECCFVARFLIRQSCMRKRDIIHRKKVCLSILAR